MSNTISQSIARPGRTAGQMTVSGALVEFAVAFGLDLDGRQYGASVVLLGLVLGLLQVVLENRGVIPALGRAVPPTQAPVVDSGRTELGLIGACLALVGILLLALGILSLVPAGVGAVGAVVAVVGVAVFGFDEGSNR